MRLTKKERNTVNSDSGLVTTKTCPRCGILLGRKHYHRDRTRADGLASWCKVCRNAEHQYQRAIRCAAANPCDRTYRE